MSRKSGRSVLGARWATNGVGPLIGDEGHKVAELQGERLSPRRLDVVPVGARGLLGVGRSAGRRRGRRAVPGAVRPPGLAWHLARLLLAGDDLVDEAHDIGEPWACWILKDAGGGEGGGH